MKRVTGLAMGVALAFALTGCISTAPTAADPSETENPSNDSTSSEQPEANEGTVEFEGWLFRTPFAWNAEKTGENINYVTNDEVTMATVGYIDSSEAYKTFQETGDDDLAIDLLAEAYIHGFEDEGYTGESYVIDLSGLTNLEGAYCKAADIVSDNKMGGGVIVLCADPATTFVGMLTYEKDKYSQEDIDDVTQDFVGIMLGIEKAA